jgi:hypothetical protein
MMEEINPLDVSVKKNGKENTPCKSKVLRENKDDVIEFNTCVKQMTSRIKRGSRTK